MHFWKAVSALFHSDTHNTTLATPHMADTDTHLTGLNASAQQPRGHSDIAATSAFPRVEDGLEAHGDNENVFKKDKRLTVGELRKLEDGGSCRRMLENSKLSHSDGEKDLENPFSERC